MGPAVLHAGSVHGHGRDKLAETGLATTPAGQVAAPLLTDAVANFECALADIVQPGDCPLLFGRVLAAHVNSDAGLQRLYTVGPGHAMGGVRALPDTLVRPTR
jgi:flavin reductase (DIM6/NTAB) family NADH-FMN oxidoreductase RutF